MATSRTIYKYHFKLGNRIVHTGIARDIDRREAEHRRKSGWGRGHIVQIGRRTTREAALQWEAEQRRLGKPTGLVIPENMDLDNPITPGEILLEEYLKPMGISQNAMARAIGVAPWAINEIVHARRSITPALSIRFGAFFGQSDEFWHGLQVECDFRKLTRKKKRLTD